MDITRIQKHARGARTIVPNDALRHLKTTPGGYLQWTLRAHGIAELRAIPTAAQLDAARKLAP